MLEEIKDYLNITWSDEDTKLQNIIDRGQERIEGLVGGSVDFSSPGLAKDLLLNYCRYDYNNAVEYFEENFQTEILRLQLNTGIDLLACLSDLSIGELSLNPEFESRIFDYTASTTDNKNVISAIALGEDATVEIEVNGYEHENNTEYEWMEGSNEVKIIVIDGDNSEIYNVTVTKS